MLFATTFPVINQQPRYSVAYGSLVRRISIPMTGCWAVEGAHREGGHTPQHPLVLNDVWVVITIWIRLYFHPAIYCSVSYPEQVARQPLPLRLTPQARIA